MNKKELIDAVAEKTDSSGAANLAVDALLGIISEGLKKDESLILFGWNVRST